ncbi:hypothetical protein QS796_16800 [Providencia rettgeri]|nr:hypothetical protein [Providencia rettgeri]MDL9988794.1 hypothetical protein [Providencia rettgeri]
MSTWVIPNEFGTGKMPSYEQKSDYPKMETEKTHNLQMVSFIFDKSSSSRE